MPQLDIMLAYEQIITTIMVSIIIYGLIIFKVVPNVLKIQSARKLLERQFDLVYKILATVELEQEMIRNSKAEIATGLEININELIKKVLRERVKKNDRLYI